MVFPTDWDRNKENVSTVIGIDSTAPIVGLGSLQVFISDTSPITERVSIQNNTYTNGILDGRIRANVRIDAMITDSTDYVGFACMQNSPTISGIPDEGYALVISGDNGLSSTTVDLIKFANGFQVITVLDSASTGVLLGSPFVLQIDWVEEVLLNGVVLKGYLGLATTDFNDLVQVVEATDIFSPFTTTVAESLVVTSFGSIPPTVDVKFDNVSIFSLVP